MEIETRSEFKNKGKLIEIQGQLVLLHQHSKILLKVKLVYIGDQRIFEVTTNDHWLEPTFGVRKIKSVNLVRNVSILRSEKNCADQ